MAVLGYIVLKLINFVLFRY